MVKIEAVYEGLLRCRVIHGPSGNEFLTDAPKDNEGKGEYFSPSDLVAASIGSCMLTVMGILASRKGIRMSGSKVEVTKEMAPHPSRRIARLAVVFAMADGIKPEHRKLLEEAARTCPVRQSLSPDIEMPISFRYDD